jgi:hypothetical protein
MEPTDQTQESGVSERFSGNTRTKFPKNCVKMKKRGPKSQNTTQAEGSNLDAAQCDSTERVRISLLRSHHNSSKSGISESTKKTGPPLVCIGL